MAIPLHPESSDYNLGWPQICLPLWLPLCTPRQLRLQTRIGICVCIVPSTVQTTTRVGSRFAGLSGYPLALRKFTLPPRVLRFVCLFAHPLAPIKFSVQPGAGVRFAGLFAYPMAPRELRLQPDMALFRSQKGCIDIAVRGGGASASSCTLPSRPRACPWGGAGQDQPFPGGDGCCFPIETRLVQDLHVLRPEALRD